ncbi:two-component system regulatory protein YycI [Paenibacillus sp. WQ 127069]|jgi:regulatory protein YycI of two-component signal transduction system YycFG|uniref:Two-component system regulatory protein YycI n=1 Tax=Paenibacillus baimaensis TaxID=2982185 RepID=A0ABT2UBB7_9BACL|nr:two-component system regulatory protein YycI [Paenibacillus sp. WQ 127069]MCU6791933.1 two-component system regulatory protein YycI [Paenibacillus sp. WQ 127069]
MDWGRAKMILIVSFFILNAVLGYQLWTTRSDLLEFDANTTSAAEEIQRLLKSKNIQISAELPKEVPRLKEIVVRFTEPGNSNKQINLEIPFKYNPLASKGSSKDNVAARAAIPNLDKYQYDPVMSSNELYVFHQLYGTLPMFEVRLEFIEQNGMVTAYRQGYVEDQLTGAQKEQKVISPYTVLRSLIETYFPSGSVVSSIKLGYHGQVFDSQTMFLVPYWRVTLGNGDIYYVHAFNGAVEPPQKNKSNASG